MVSDVNLHPYSKVGQLQGHSASVTQVWTDDNLNQLVSLSSDKTMKVWDLRNNRCVQTFQDETHYRPENRISSLTYDNVRSRLVTATTRLKVNTRRVVQQALDPLELKVLLGFKP